MAASGGFGGGAGYAAGVVIGDAVNGGQGYARGSTALGGSEVEPGGVQGMSTVAGNRFTEVEEEDSGC